MTRHLGNAMRRLSLALLVAVLLFYLLFPFYWAVVTSLKSGIALFGADPLPDSPTFANYVGVFREQPFARNILNSLIVAGATVALSLGLALGAAYAFGRIVFAGRRLLLLAILMVSMFPQVAVLSGLFELVRWLGIYNTL
jgi:trehalose/maltose transport system permease protein